MYEGPYSEEIYGKSTQGITLTWRVHPEYSSRLLLWHLTVRGAGPDYLKQVVRPVSEVSCRSFRSASRGDLFVSRANTSIGQRSFSIAAPVVWNALPLDLRSPHISRQQFWSKLKTHLFRQAYNTAWFLWEQFAEECNFVIVIVIQWLKMKA